MAIDNVIQFGKAADNGSYDAVSERTKNAIGKKIAAARKQHGYKLNYMVEALHNFGIDISAKAISKWEYGESIPNGYQLVALSIILDLHEFQELILSYIPPLNDEGVQKVDTYRDDLIASGKYAFKPAPTPKKHVKTRRIGFSTLPVSAGVGEYLLENNMEMRDIPEYKIAFGADFALPISGNSMEPEYHDGEYVWVHATTEVPENAIGIFEYGDCGYIKKYGEQDPADEVIDSFTDSYGTVSRQPVLYSLNPAYDPIEISPHREFRTIGIVVGKYIPEDAE